MPALRCVKGHSLPLDQEFMVWLIHELKDRGEQRCPPARPRA